MRAAGVIPENSRTSLCSAKELDELWSLACTVALQRITTGLRSREAVRPGRCRGEKRECKNFHLAARSGSAVGVPGARIWAATVQMGGPPAGPLGLSWPSSRPIPTPHSRHPHPPDSAFSPV